MMARIRAPRPVTVSSAERVSTGGAAGSEVSGSRKTQAAMPISTSGTLTRNTEPHQKWSSSQPPTRGPSGSPSAEAAEIAPTAVERSPGPKSEGRTDIASGMISAAPVPITARAPMTSGALSARVPNREPARKMPRPQRSIRRRPNLSPRSPAGSIRPAKTTA